VRWIAWLFVAACSSGSTTRGQVQPIPAPGDPEPAQAGPSERDCDELITHAVALGIDEQLARPGEPRTTQADHEAVRRKLHEDFMTDCRTLPRDAFRCAIAATTLSGLAACQPTRKSSTSNSSVAPGGMVAPAPRSP
jgi:citrate synthase